MKFLLEKLKGDRAEAPARRDMLDQWRRQVAALYTLLGNLYGADKLVLKASKLEALNLMRSDHLAERVLALQKIVFEDPTIDTLPDIDNIPAILEEIEDALADILARKTVEEDLEKKINQRLEERHEEYIQEIRQQVVREKSGPENAQTLKKLAMLERKDQLKLSRTAMEFLRPNSFEEIVGQERAVKALLAKLASPFPQHVILYGPPGVGKTSAARLALQVAKGLGQSPFASDAPFVEVDGSTLRWDPRDVTNPLLGSVHDPIYQGARRDLAESGVPEPKLGLVTDAHGGVLFIDEIGEMDPLLQSKLLKVLEDKRVYFDSAYYDPGDTSVPKYIRKIFEEGAPADFILIGATTRDPEDINPAIRSRCAEVYFEPLTPQDIEEIIRKAARKLGVTMDEAIPALIAEYTIEGRKAINIMADAYGLALYKSGKPDRRPHLRVEDIYEVVQVSRLSPYLVRKASDHLEVGKIFGLGVWGFVGSVLEIEALVFEARTAGQGSIRFNDTAGSMAKDSVFNAAAVIRKVTGEDLSNYDVHVNVVGGGRIDGPSAGTAICLATLSAMKGWPLPQDIAVTGEISIQGKIRAVGGIVEKIYGARQAGVRTVFIPAENAKDVPEGLQGLKVVPVATIEEIMDHVFKERGLTVQSAAV